jgi:hypothetical protein
MVASSRLIASTTPVTFQDSAAESTSKGQRKRILRNIFIIDLDAKGEGKFCHFDSLSEKGGKTKRSIRIWSEIQTVNSEYPSFYRIEGPKD